MISVIVEKKDLYFITSILVFAIAVSLVIAWDSDNPAVHGHTANEIQGASGGGVIVNNVNMTYVWCNLTIVGRDYSGDSEKCAVNIHYDGNNYFWGSPEHSEYNDAACWRDVDLWMKSWGFDGYVYLGKVPGNSGDSFNCTMTKITSVQ